VRARLGHALGSWRTRRDESPIGRRPSNVRLTCHLALSAAQLSRLHDRRVASHVVGEALQANRRRARLGLWTATVVTLVALSAIPVGSTVAQANTGSVIPGPLVGRPQGVVFVVGPPEEADPCDIAEAFARRLAASTRVGEEAINRLDVLAYGAGEECLSAEVGDRVRCDSPRGQGAGSKPAIYLHRLGCERPLEALGRERLPDGSTGEEVPLPTYSRRRALEEHAWRLAVLMVGLISQPGLVDRAIDFVTIGGGARVVTVLLDHLRHWAAEASLRLLPKAVQLVFGSLSAVRKLLGAIEDVVLVAPPWLGGASVEDRCERNTGGPVCLQLSDPVNVPVAAGPCVRLKAWTTTGSTAR